jgi:beta-glucosidase
VSKPLLLCAVTIATSIAGGQARAADGRAADGVVQADVVAHGTPLLSIDGLQFKDLNRNGKLDPYEDWRRAPASRTADLIARLTLPEKAGLMMHAANSGFFGPGGAVLREPAAPPPGALKPPVNVPGVPGFDRADKPSPYDLILNNNVRWINTSPGGTRADAARWANALQDIAAGSRLGIPVMLSADPVQTTNRMPGGALPPPQRRKITSSWPDQIGLAATGDPLLVREFGRIAAAEYRALGFRMILNPMADLATEPRWNRIPGTFGEDAELSARLVTEYVRGFQGDKLGPDSVLTVVKHFPGEGPVAKGLDPHNPYGRFQIYPGGRQEYHLIPFRAAFAAGAAGVMTSYAIPQGIDTVGVAFSKTVISGMLRGELKFDGIVLTDWLHAMPWGVESLSKRDRELRMIEAGVDQLGGEHDPRHIIALAKQGKISRRRLDESMRRLLTPMFALGMFENPYVDPERATAIVNSPAFQAAGENAQRRSIVLLKNAGDVLPLKKDAKLFLSGFDTPPAVLATRMVTDIAAADVAIVKVNAPYALRNDGTSFFRETHEGTLAYAGAENAADLAAIRTAAQSGKPVVVVMSMERPAILSEFIDDVAAIIATFGSGDNAIADILTDVVAPTGQLPFDLPADLASVENQAEDAPHDFADTLFPAGFGLHFSSRPSLPPGLTY